MTKCAPYGYALVEGQLVEVEAEQAVIRAVRKAKAAGLTFEQIASVLRELGLMTPKECVDESARP